MPHRAPLSMASQAADPERIGATLNPFRALFENAPDAYLATDRAGRIEAANRAAGRLFECDAERLLGIPLEDFIDPADRPAFLEHLAEMSRGARERVADWHFLLCPKEGRRVCVSASVVCDPPDDADPGAIRWLLRNDPQRELFESDLRGAVILAEERERSKLSQDLHDDLSQLLALVGMRLGKVRDLAPSHLREPVLEIEQLIRQASERTSSLTFQLHPPVLKSEGLVPAARWLADDLQRRYGLHVKIETQGEVGQIAEPTRIVLFRSLRELLVNAAKHAQTHEAHVTISRLERALRVEVADRGVGFDPTPEQEGFGLRSIRERVHYLGGSLKIESAPHHGTKARVTVPLKA